MIGSRVLAAVTALALVVVLGAGAPRPEIARGAHEAVADAADRTLEAIHRLDAHLAQAVDAARSGAARVVAGNEDPAGPLAAAADRVLGSAPETVALREALADLESARWAIRPAADPLPPATDAGDLASIAAQLEDAGEAGARFAETRRGAEAVTAGLADALNAAAAGRTDDADQLLEVSQAAVDEMRAWEENAPVLATWIGTADAMIRAMQRLVDAVRANDSGEAEAAQADFDAAAENAPAADRALRIGLGEAGSALTSVALGRLAAVLVDLDELEAAARAARAEVGE